MLRIAVITPYFPIKQEYYRGHSAYQTVRQMTRRAEVQVFCPAAVYPQRFEPRSYRYHPPALDFAPPGVSTQYVSYPTFPVLCRPLNGFVCYRHLLPTVRAWNPSIVLNYWLYPEGYSATKVAAALGVPCVVGGIGSDLCAPKDPFTAALLCRTLKLASAVIVLSEDLRQRALAFGAYPDRTWTVPNGCDTTIFYPQSRTAARAAFGLRNDDRIILFVGSLTISKGIFELIAALELLSRYSRSIQLLIIGEGTCQRTLQERIAMSPIAPCVHLLGRRTSDEIARHLSACDVFCLPSHREGCPNSVIEAICCGRPVVATSVGGIPELLSEDCGALVRPGDAVELAGALERTLSRQWNPTQICAHFDRTWEDVAEETLDVCQRVFDMRTRFQKSRVAAQSV